jgi:hypothetical protein
VFLTQFEEKMVEFLRRGDEAKVKWMRSLDKTVLPSQVKRIQQNDKTVLFEMVLPQWVDWSLLQDWANNKKSHSGDICILCSTASEHGITYLEKHICESCFLKLKHMQ